MSDTQGEDEDEALLWSPELSEKDINLTNYHDFFPHLTRSDAANAIEMSTPTPPPKYRILSNSGGSPPLRSALAIRHGPTGSPRSATVMMTTIKKKTVRWEDDVFVLEKKVVGVPVRKESCPVCTPPRRTREGVRFVDKEGTEEMLMGHMLLHEEDDSFLRVD